VRSEAERAQPDIIPRRITHIRLAFDDLHLREPGARHRRRAVAGGIVHHANLKREVAARSVHRAQALAQQVTRIPVDDHNAEVEHRSQSPVISSQMIAAILA
jgi:RNA 3'-terminal phosphate cyclase